MKRVSLLLLCIVLTVMPFAEQSHAAVKEKKFAQYQDQLPVELQSHLNDTKKIKKIVEDINWNGDIDQLYWLAEIWMGLDVNRIEEKNLRDYFNWESVTICHIIQKDTIFQELQDGRNVFLTFYSSFYPRSNTRAKLVEAAQMIQIIHGFHLKEIALFNIPKEYYDFAKNAFYEDKKIQIHYVERMLFGSDRYSCTHISPGPDKSVTDSIADLLGNEVIKDPTRLPEKIAVLPEEKDNALLANLENIIIFAAYYLSYYDLSLCNQYTGAAALRNGVLQSSTNRIFEALQKLIPTQYEFLEEYMVETRTNNNQQILNDFIQYQDSLRRNGYMFVNYSLFGIPQEWQESEAFYDYVDQYLRIGYELCKEIMQGGGYTYIVKNAETIREFLRIMGYYHISYPDNLTWMTRFSLYISDLSEITQYRYYNTHDSWMIGAAWAEYAVLRAFIEQNGNDRLYEQLMNSVSFFYSALNNEKEARNILDIYIIPPLAKANIVSRDKEWNCYHMWYYASVLPYTYLLYTEKEDKEYGQEIGRFFAEMLLQAVRYNKKCDNNAQALSALAEYYYNIDSITIGNQLLEEYFALTGDTLTYYGYKFAINYWHEHDYKSAASYADIVNRDDPAAMGNWYNEYCLSPARCYALAGREEEAMEQLQIFNDYMQKEIGKQLLSIGADQASNMIKRYDNINDRFVMLCEDTLSSAMGNEFMRSFYNWQLQSKGMLLALNSEADSLLARHSDRYIRELFFRCKQREQALADMNDLNSSEAIILQNNLIKAKTNLQIAIQEYIDKNGFEGVNKVGWEDVRAALKEGQVAIEIANGKIDEDTIPVYYALLLRHDSEAPTPVRLFAETDIQPLIETQNSEQIHRTYSYSARGKQLSKMVWGNILPHIKEGEVVFFSPSGILHQLAIESLPYDPTQVMADRYNMVRLSSTREVIGGKKPIHHATATLYGDIQYSATPQDLAIEHRKYATTHSSEDLAMAAIKRMTLRDMALDLPGTKIEVDSIEEMLKQKHMRVNAYRGRSATEESFKALSSKGTNIIHLATHGFYWPEKEAKQQKFFTQNSTIESDIQQALPIDPLDRCGLLFAGANTALGGHSARLDKGVQDGILTAKEISAMDLRGTDIVVLSACETGLGDVSGDGVFGLQRAFKKAGAQTMLMALWKVSDDATRLLMTSFYRYMNQGMSKRQAFRAAQQEVRNYTSGDVSSDDDRAMSGKEKKLNKGKMTDPQPKPASSDKKPSANHSNEEVTHPYASPYYWAGFILLD